MRKYILPILGSLILLLAYLCLEKHESHSEESLEFTIDKPYLQTVRNLATKNSLERIAEDNNATVTGKYWDHFNVEVPQKILRLKDYKINGTLRFTVSKEDPDLGDLRLTFVQDMDLDEHILRLNTKLLMPDPKIPVISKMVEISPLVEEDMPKTHVLARSELKVRKTIPFFLRDHMDKMVEESNRKDLERLKNKIMEVSEQKNLITFQRQAARR